MLSATIANAIRGMAAFDQAHKHVACAYDVYVHCAGREFACIYVRVCAVLIHTEKVQIEFGPGIEADFGKLVGGAIIDDRISCSICAQRCRFNTVNVHVFVIDALGLL